MEALREHLEHPAGRGKRPADAFDGTAGGAACGDLIRISLAVSGERVTAAGFGSVKAPKKWKAFKTAAAKDLAAGELVVAQYAARIKPTTSFADALAAEGTFQTAIAPISKRLNKKFDGQGLFRCGSAF